MGEDLTTLVVAAQKGDNSAFDRIVARFQDQAVAYAYALLGDSHGAQDAAQDAFLLAFQELHTLREPAAFPAWLSRIVFKCCDRRKRRRGFRSLFLPLEDVLEIPAPSTNPAALLEEKDRKDQIHAAIRALPEAERTAILLFYIDEHSQAEIAEFLKVAVTAVKKRLQRARARLQERMMTMIRETVQSNRPSKDTRFVEASSLRRRILRLLESDSRVEAAYLAHFGTDEGFGTDDDIWSSLNLHVILNDSSIDDMALERRAFAERLEPALIYVEGPQNAPPGGYYLMTLFDGECGPHEVDWYWRPRRNAEIPAEAQILFDRGAAGIAQGSQPLPWDYTDQIPAALARVREAITEEANRAEETRNVISLFWAMLLITAKYVARNPHEDQMSFLPMLCDLMRKARQRTGSSKEAHREYPPLPDPAAKLAILRELASQMEVIMPVAARLGAVVPPAIVPSTARFLALVEASLSSKESK